jgi:hypothetical protein
LNVILLFHNLPGTNEEDLHKLFSYIIDYLGKDSKPLSPEYISAVLWLGVEFAHLFDITAIKHDAIETQDAERNMVCGVWVILEAVVGGSRSSGEGELRGWDIVHSSVRFLAGI